MSGIQKVVIDGKEILSVDYSDCKEEEIMVLASELLSIGLAENKRLLILSTYNEKNFITPKVMRHMEKVTKQGLHLIHKMAIVGLSPTKRVILKGYNLLFKRDFKAFDTREKAIAFLIGDDPS